MPAKPKGFVTCYVCQREFGSQSIGFHEPQCLQKWRNENNKLPPNQRSSTPRRPSDCTYTSSAHVAYPPPQSTSHAASRHLSRPRTATLDQPAILDVNFLHEVDMTNHSKQATRSRTFYLIQPTPNLKIPRIQTPPVSNGPPAASELDVPPTATKCISYVHNGSGERVVVANANQKSQQLKGRLLNPRGHRSDAVKQQRQQGSPESPPELCSTCGNGNLSERFHSHPRKNPVMPRGACKAAAVVAVMGDSGHADQRTRPLAEGLGRLVFNRKGIRNGSHFDVVQDTLAEVDEQSTNEEEAKSESTVFSNRHFRRSNRKSCSTCGRLFSTCVLQTHQSVCSKNRYRINRKQSQHSTVELEPSSRQDEIGPMQKSEPRQLVRCSNCNEQVYSDRYAAHHRACQAGGSRPADATLGQESSSPVSSVSPTNGSLLGRRFIICYICGRDFGTKSIAIHEPQCLKKWQAENAKLPKRLQRSEPQKPDVSLNSDGTFNLDAFVDAAWQSHLGQLVACAKCNRTFNPDRLAVHEKICISNRK